MFVLRICVLPISLIFEAVHYYLGVYIHIGRY